jgi:hydrogenase maturation protein HypF
LALIEKLRLEIGGAVQGVGFRPFVFRLARDLDLDGWVINDGRGVFIEVEGQRSQLEEFRSRVEIERPPRAVVMKVTCEWGASEGFDGFSIRASDEKGRPTVVVLPEVATCDECMAEVLDPADRRYRYPFTNCTNCGPRFSIVRRLPYDRPNTTMDRFRMCESCQEEYDQPLDRRFHAQPNACAECGPAVELWNSQGRCLASGAEAVDACARELTRGQIIALKGLGGFLLLVDAADEKAISELRRRKRRYEKPLALMVPDLATASAVCRVSDRARELLTSPEAPIVLLDRSPGVAVSESVAPGTSRLGVMLPYSPLHHLVLRGFGAPLVATSGNVSDEPMCIENDDALHRLSGIADLFLVHDRPIERHVDDSVIQLIGDEVQPLRRARGYAPLPIQVGRELPTILAVGGHLKNVAALSVEDKVFLSQHIGDMETPEARTAFERVIGDFIELYEAEPACIARDLHPEYPSSKWVESQVSAESPGGQKTIAALAGLPTVRVQHHHAHLASVLAEHRIEEPALGVVWDGTGYGLDGTIWGGEFLVGDARSFDRLAALRPFRLPGGDAAVRQPKRVALALLWELAGRQGIEGDRLEPFLRLSSADRRPLIQMLESGFRAPVTTSAGRLFDAVASLLDLRHEVAFEGQAAMQLEFAADHGCRDAYPLPIERTAPIDEGIVAQPRFFLDWRALVEAVLEDSRSGRGVGMIAARFHNALAEGIVNVAREAGQERVALTGGCFQNGLLSTRTAERLTAAGFEVLQHRQVPANDGGLSLGQITVAAAQLEAGGEQESKE